MKKPPPEPLPAAAKKKAAEPVAAAAKKKPSASAKKKPAAAVPAAAKKKEAAVVSAAGRKKPAAAKNKPPAKVSAIWKKKPAAAASAAAKKMTAAAVPAAAKKMPAAAPDGTARRRPRKRARDGSGDADLISDLPDAILGTIISLLPTKDGARTQAIARRWRPLWRSAPLNIDADDLSTADPRFPPRRRGRRPRLNSVISRILSDHPGPVRRLDFRISTISRTAKDAAKIESWFQSPSLDNLQELHVIFPFLIIPDSWELCRLPSSLLRFALTIVVATIGHCDFPDELAPSLNFPLLKHLALRDVSISPDVFHGLISACSVLETLHLEQIHAVPLLHISSPTLRSVGFRSCYMRDGEVVIEDTPHLERLLCLDLHCEALRVNGAPKLEILGPLSPDNSNIQIGKLVFQSNKYLTAQMENVRQYDPRDPVKCLQTHLKKLVFKNYKGDEQDVSFAKFFVLNAEVLNEIKFGVNKKTDKKWVADQHSLLGVQNKTSPDAQIEFVLVSYSRAKLDTHDLSTPDPFNGLLADAVDALKEGGGSCD